MKSSFQFIVVLFVVFTVFTGCSKSTDGDDYIERVTPVENQTVTAKTSTSISFNTLVGWGNGCGQFSRSVVVKTDSVYLIKILGKEPKDAVCTAVLISFNAPVTINLPSTGTYIFKFWRSDSTSRDTTITIQ